MDEDQPNELQLDWSALRSLLARPRLSSFTSNPVKLFDDYYRISVSEYVHASRQWDDEFTEETIYVNSFIWAPSFPSLRRAVSRNSAIILEDDGCLQTLPESLRLGPNCICYEQIVDYIHDSATNKFYHYDIYDEKSQAIGSYLQVNALSYFFRTAQPVPRAEQPYVVELSTNRRILRPTD